MIAKLVATGAVFAASIGQTGSDCTGSQGLLHEVATGMTSNLI